MGYRNADKIPAAVRLAMDEPGAVLEYRSGSGRLLAEIKRQYRAGPIPESGQPSVELIPLGVWATVYVGHPRKPERTYYSKIGLATGHVEREILRSGLVAEGEWSREVLTRKEAVARVHTI